MKYFKAHNHGYIRAVSILSHHEDMGNEIFRQVRTTIIVELVGYLGSTVCCLPAQPRLRFGADIYVQNS